jgi:acetylornithine deacetylase
LAIKPDVVELSRELIRIPSVSRDSNRAVTEAIEGYLQAWDFELERLSYLDQNGSEKLSLVAKKGQGKDGFGFFSHSDTVPGAEEDWAAFDPVVKEGRLYGRGSCDMKGPLAATMLAAASFEAASLKKPVYVVVTADEEQGFGGASQIAQASELLKASWPDMAVVAEPSQLTPIYAHKGGYFMVVTAKGLAAHSSTDQGISANFLMAPFLAEMTELKKLFMSDPGYQDSDFEPPTNGFNMTLSDDNCANNVTAAKTVCSLNFRAMPKVASQAVIKLIADRAAHYGFELETHGYEAFFVEPTSAIVRLTLQITGAAKAVTVPYGTEALIYQQYVPTVILGPGNIEQAHTVGEWIELKQLERAVEVYQQLIRSHCL